MCPVTTLVFHLAGGTGLPAHDPPSRVASGDSSPSTPHIPLVCFSMFPWPHAWSPQPDTRLLLVLVGPLMAKVTVLPQQLDPG